MKQFLKELFEYGNYVNQEIAEVINDNPDKVSEKVLKLYSHVLNAHQIWNNRIDPRQITFGVWEIQPAQEFKDIDKMNYKHSLLILDEFGLNKTINYITGQGQPFSNSVRDVLFHVINHSTYHRGQIATELKQSGIEPLNTDYIFYKR